MKINTSAFVLGLYGGNGLSIVRSLGSEGINVYGFHVGTRFPVAKYSKYTKGALVATSEQQLVDNIVETASKIDNKPVIHTTDDRYIKLIIENAQQLEGVVINPYKPGSACLKLMDKSNNMTLGLNAGFAIPKIVSLKEEISLEEEYLIKPENSTLGGKEDFQILSGRLISDSNILQNAKENKLIVQRYIGGTDCEHISITGYYSGEKICYISMCKRLHALSTKRIKQLRPFTSSWEPYWNDSLIPKVEMLLKNLKLHVPVNIDLVHDKTTDMFYYLETNLRIGGDHMIFTKSGINFPSICHWDLTGESIKLTATPRRTKAKAVLTQENREITYFLKDREIPAAKAIKDLSGKKFYMFFDIGDLKPFFAMLFQEFRFHANN